MPLHKWARPVFLFFVKAGARVCTEITITLGIQQPFTSHRDARPPPSREHGLIPSLTLSSCPKKTAAGFCFCFILILNLFNNCIFF